MNIKEISEKEFAIIQEISKNHLPHQRMISKKTGISLGLTNLIIKKLIRRGIVKSKQLNQHKVQYILTPKGFIEKARKSYSYTLKTFKVIRSVKENISQLIASYQQKGINNFIILGNDDLSEIIEDIFKTSDNPDIKYSVLSDYNLSLLKEGQGTLYLITESGTKSMNSITIHNSVNVVSHLSESNILFSN